MAKYLRIAVVSLAVLFLGSVVSLFAHQSDNPSFTRTYQQSPANSEHQRIHSLEGKITINASDPMPTGVILAYGNESRRHVAGSAITVDGSYRINNLPDGPIVLLLSSKVLEEFRSPGYRKLLELHHGSRSTSTVKAVGPKVVDFKMLPSSIQADLRKIDELYGDMRSPKIIKTVIAEGLNHLDIDLDLN